MGIDTSSPVIFGALQQLKSHYLYNNIAIKKEQRDFTFYKSG